MTPKQFLGALPKLARTFEWISARKEDRHPNTVQLKAWQTWTARRVRQALQLERQFSDLVNEAYGLTPAEVALLQKEVEH